MTLQEELKSKSLVTLVAEYRNLMDQILSIWDSVEPGQEMSSNTEYMLSDIETTADAYMKEIQSRGHTLPEWTESDA